MNLKGVLKTRHSIFFSWLRSYILILLIPIAFTGTVYFINIKTLEKEVNRVNLAMLKQVQLTMDNILKDAERLGYDIAFNPYIQSLTNLEESQWLDNQYTVYQVLEEFKRMDVTNGYIKSFYIYFKNLDAVISSKTASKTDLMYSVLGHNADIKLENWKEMLQATHTGSYTSISDKKDNNKHARTIAYLRSIPISDLENPPATIVILFNENRFMEMIQNIQRVHFGDIFIVDKNNNTLACTAAYNLSDIIQFNELMNNNGKILKGKEKEPIIVSHTQSAVSELKYVSIVPRKIVMEKIDYSRNIMFASIIFCLILGVVVSVLLTHRNYNPVRKLINLWDGKIKGTYGNSDNEYQLIYNAIQGELEEKEKIHQKLEQQNSVVRADFLQKLLKGKLGSKISVHDAFYTLDIQFDSNEFAVLLIAIEDKGKIVSSETVDDFEEEHKLTCFVITNVFGELLRQKYKGFVTEIDERIACLINLKNMEGINPEQELIRISEEAQQFLKNYYNMILTISISDIHQNISGISSAFQEAEEAMEYKMIAGNGKVICFHSLKNCVRNYFYPFDKEQKLVNCIKSGEYEKGKELLDEIINSNFVTGTPSVAMTRCLMFDLTSTIVKTVQEISVNQPVEKLFECETIKELQKEITNILLSVCSQIQSKMSNRTHELSKNIMEFIHIHYLDPNLNIAMVADHFEITPTYMSKLFKEQTGEGMLDYINKTRLEKAKELLKDAKLSISETAVKVGYANSNALIRSFKRYEGVTPGQYKGTESCDA